MKKISKIFCMILAVCLMIPAICLLSACEKDPVTIEVSTFEEFKTAVAGNADIIKLGSNILLTETIRVNRKVTLDLDEKWITNTQEIWCKATENDWSLISVGNNGDLTITGNGWMRALENDCYCLDVVDGGRLTIENGYFDGNITAVYAYDGHVDIKGGQFKIQQTNPNNVEGPYGLTINIYNNDPDKDGNRKLENKATVTITGGEYLLFDPAAKTDNKVDDFVPEGYKSVKQDDWYKIVKAD